MESWNRANSVIFYGKGGDIATNRRDEQETAVLCLRILQAALVYVNTLMLQDVLADPDWAAVLNAEDQRGLTPLFWTHVLPYVGDDCGSAGAVCTRLDQVRDRPASGDQPPDGAGVPEGPAAAGPAGAVRAGGVRPVRRVRPAAAGRRPASVGQHAVRRADGAGLCR